MFICNNQTFFLCFFSVYSICNATFFHSGYVIKPPQPSSTIYRAPPFTGNRINQFIASRDEHGSELDQDWSQFLAGSGLDRTAIFFLLAEQDLIGLKKFVVLMWLFQPHQKCYLWCDFTDWLNCNVYFAINGKSSAGTILLCIQLCPGSTYSAEVVLLATRWTSSRC